MTATRTALVTGATQNLGRALAEGLAARLSPGDRVLLTGRDPERVAAVAAAVPAGGATVEPRVLDVRDPAAIAALAEELGDVDVVFSNATARMSPADDPAAMVDLVATTNNVATTAVLRAFGPRMRPGGRLVVVASALGTLDKLDPRVRGRFADAARDGLNAVDALTDAWRDAVRDGRAEAEGFGTWLNVPSKVLQVAAVRAAAGELREDRLVVAVCPGLIDTPASRPWFADMSEAQTPEAAAAWPLELALSHPADPAFHGELVQFGRVAPWETGLPVPHRALAAARQAA